MDLFKLTRIGGILIIWLLVACQQQSSSPITERVTTVPHRTPTALEATTATPRPILTTAATAAAPQTPTPPTSPTRTPRPTASPSYFGTGALISLRMESEVGVLLDDFPEAMRDRVAADLLEKPDAFWLDRANQQILLTYNRLHFRGFAYRKVGIIGKEQLPFPPLELWQVELDAAGPRRTTVEGHDLVMIGYTFSSTLLSDAASPAVAEPALGNIGGMWDEPFVFPADPTLVFQRTGNACLNEGGFPPNSYDSENVASFYDYTCQANDGGLAGCHRSVLPQLSCQQALQGTVGRITTNLRFERLPWDSALADSVRTGEVTQVGVPDLKVVAEELGNYRIVYRYFDAGNCALNEGTVGGTGWRRLLMFDAVVHNLGTRALHIGPVTAEDPNTNIFEYDACHNHIHYSHYGDFLFGETAAPNKRAFCVESTGRFSNNETSPLVHPYTCRFQGIEAGWVDEYGAGLDGQWIDITEVFTETAETATIPLTFRSNTDEFLCEGTPVLDENGEQLYAFSGLENKNGLPIAYPVCKLAENWEVNNVGSRDIPIPPTGSFVTEECEGGEVGPLRNCGFEEDAAALRCEPGEAVQMVCELNAADEDAASQLLRVCESSAVLGAGTACTYTDALANLIVGKRRAQLNFFCPAERDASEPGGLFSFYTAPLYPDDAAESISCERVESEP